MGNLPRRRRRNIIREANTMPKVTTIMKIFGVRKGESWTEKEGEMPPS